MWLDRLSSHSTPSGSPPPPANRSYGPAGRRPSHLGPASNPQRGGFSPRSSSLSLVSNDSTTSLLAPARKLNGSGLRQSSTVAEVKDPLEFLQNLLGADEKTLAGNETHLELDFGGFTLREFVGDCLPLGKTAYDTQTIEECTEPLPVCTHIILCLF